MKRIRSNRSHLLRGALLAVAIAALLPAGFVGSLEPAPPNLWSVFLETEIRASYSVNTIFGAHAGRLPFTLLTGSLAFLTALAAAGVASARGRGSFAHIFRRSLPAAFAVTALLFAARSGLDQARIVSVDDEYFRGRSMDEKKAMLNPRGLYPLLLEGKRMIPPGADVVFRAEKPFPWEKGGYYLYPRRVSENGEWIISYLRSAPADSASCELLFRREGTGSIYSREKR